MRKKEKGIEGGGKRLKHKIEAVLKRNDGKSEEGFELNRKFSGMRRWEGGGIKYIRGGIKEAEK